MKLYNFLKRFFEQKYVNFGKIKKLNDKGIIVVF